MKKMDETPSLELSPTDPCQKVLILSEKAFIGKFTGLWHNSKVVKLWIIEHWNPNLQGRLSLFVARRVFFVFLFSNKEERDLVFHLGPFFMGSRGLFLSPWTLGLNP